MSRAACTSPAPSAALSSAGCATGNGRSTGSEQVATTHATGTCFFSFWHPKPLASHLMPEDPFFIAKPPLFRPGCSDRSTHIRADCRSRAHKGDNRGEKHSCVPVETVTSFHAVIASMRGGSRVHLALIGRLVPVFVRLCNHQPATPDAFLFCPTQYEEPPCDRLTMCKQPLEWGKHMLVYPGHLLVKLILLTTGQEIRVRLAVSPLFQMSLASGMLPTLAS